MAVSYLKTKKESMVERIPLWTDVKGVESDALTQLRNIASLPWVAHMAVMPDVHLGKGATVGSVIAMRGAVSPSAVGVDIGCGMGAVLTNLIPDEVLSRAKEIRSRIEEQVPVGFNSHVGSARSRMNKKLVSEADELMKSFKGLTKEVQDGIDRSVSQLGTLGGGNHFIEVNLDGEGRVWFMLHSGSRWIGKTLAEVHITIAKKLGHNMFLPDKELAVFLSQTPEMGAYRNDLYWAQRYAALNRRVMMDLIVQDMRRLFPSLKTSQEVWCHHNYVAEEVHHGEELVVTRKGAIDASVGKMGIIPGAMGTKSYIVKGLGCEEALRSAPHGAGRRFSRNMAKKVYTLDDLEEQTRGTECRKDHGVLDEIPGAYKPIDEVIAFSSELVEVVAELQPAIVCVKG